MPDKSQDKHKYWQLFRDVAVFQIKLAMDGLRDLFLSPISIGAAVWGIITNPSNPDKYFAQLMNFGHKTDEWINLFGNVDEYESGKQSSDKYVHKAQEMLVNQYQQGGMVKKVKDGTDNLVDRIQKK